MQSILAIIFFVLFFINNNIAADLTFFIIIIGAFYTGMNKALKDSFYEPTKEMLYIPMAKKDKQEGKAFISLIINKTSKSVSSGYQQILILIFGQFANASLSIFAFLLIAFAGWIYNIKRIAFFMEKESTHPTEPSEITPEKCWKMSWQANFNTLNFVVV